MGYCQIIPFTDGMPQAGIEFRNPWRGAPMVWETLYDKYLKNPQVSYDSWLTSYRKDEGRALWDLAKRDDLPRFERAVHAFTFDLAYIANEHFEQFATDLREFERRYPVEYPTHLSAWANLIDSMENEAVGLYGTSVSENPWNKYDEEKDAMIATPLSDGFEVYDWLASLAVKTPSVAMATTPDDAIRVPSLNP